MTPDYVAIGGITLDWVANARGDVNHGGCGGNALYSAVGAHVWSEAVAVVGRAAQSFPDAYLAAFANAGIDVSGIRRVEAPYERRSALRYDENGNRFQYCPDEVIESWGCKATETMEGHRLSGIEAARIEARTVFNPTPADTPPYYWQARGFHLASMGHEAQLAFVEAFNSRLRLFTLDPGCDMNPVEAQELLRMVPVFLPSEDDVARLVGLSGLEHVLESLSAFGPKVVVMKLGRQGSLVCDTHTGQYRRVPIYPTATKDPTGAGDAYCGGFLVGLTETGDAYEAALWATVSASFVIEEFDARYALAFSRRDAEVRLQALKARIEACG